MSQIITVSIGGCGTKVGLKFWDTFYQNMKNKDGNQHNKYQNFIYQNHKSEKYPRAVFIDSDVRYLDQVYINSPINFDQTSTVIGNGTSCSNVYAQGKYSQASQSRQMYQQSIRLCVEKCDNLSGFIIIRSVLGGAGSGIGDQVIKHIYCHYPNKMIQQFKILQGYNPKKHNNLNQLQIYNTVLSTPCSLNNTDMVYFFQNNTVLEMFQNRRTNQCDLKLINKFYGTCLNRHISSYIQHGQLNTNQRKRATNLLLYPRIKHLTCGISQPNTKNTLMSALQIQNRLLSFPEKTDSRMFAVNVNVKQKLASQFSINKTVKTWANLTQNSFVQWLSNNISQTIGRVKENQDESSWVIFNGTSNISWKKNLGDFFASSFRRKSFVWHYTSRGMDEMQFTQSQSTLNDLISEYTVYDGYVPEQQEQIYQ